MTIWKFQLDPVKITRAPKGWKPLSVQMQNGVPCLWALVDEHAEIIEQPVEIVGTGWNAKCVAGLDFLDTVQIGALVFHIFVGIK